MKIFAVLLLLSLTASAKSNIRNHQASREEISRARAQNRKIHEQAHLPIFNPEFFPVQDTANFAYVLMSANEVSSNEVHELRHSIAQNLPAGVRLVILASADEKDRVTQEYSEWIKPENLIVATDTDANVDNGFWARDSFPMPMLNPKTGETSLVETNYYREFHSGPAVAAAVNGHLSQNPLTFVGGNLLADEDGNCFSVQSYRLFDLKQDDFSQIFGCRQWHSMAHLAGIGDVDEVLKPLPGHRILTNQVGYKADLESWGYQVILLPELSGTNRTYANALIVHDVVFMPTYGVAEDQIATKVYEGLGYKVIGISSNEMSDQMNGSIHCQTMAYPPMSKEKLLTSLGKKELR